MSKISASPRALVLLAMGVIVSAIFSFPIKVNACVGFVWGSDCAVWSFLIGDSRAAQPVATPPPPPTAAPSSAAVGAAGKSCAEDYVIKSPEWEACVDNLNKLYSTLPITETQILQYEASCGADYKKGTLQFDRCVDDLTKGYAQPRITESQVLSYEDSCEYDYERESPQWRTCVDNLIKSYEPTTVTIAREDLGRFETSCRADYEEGSGEYRQCVDNLIKLYSPPPVAKEPTTWPELPDSAYAPLPKTTARQNQECIDQYNAGEIDYGGFLKCLPEEQLNDVNAGPADVQTIMGLPAQKVEYDIPSSVDLDSAEDSSEWNNWTLSRNRAAERENLEGGVSAGLGSSFLNFFSWQQRESPTYTFGGADLNESQTTSRSFLSGWDPFGQIKSLLGIEEKVRYAEPRTGWDANPDEPGILFRHPEITDYSGELLPSPEEPASPEVVEPAPDET